MQFHDAQPVNLQVVHKHAPFYDRVQDEVVRASADLSVLRMLDLGVGTGETSRRCLEAHPAARAVGVDADRDMLHASAGVLGDRAELRLGRLEDPLPEGPFELVVSAFALHHLAGPVKADLFTRIADRLSEGGRFVMADVVVPDTPVSEPTPLHPGEGKPDRTGDWLRQAGLQPELRWAENDLAVIAASARVSSVSAQLE